MTDTSTSTSKTYGDLAPWWAWGYVLAIPFLLLALVTKWFHAVPPVVQGVDTSGQYIDLTAWSHLPSGIVGPILLITVSIQWYRARRHWALPPGPHNWRRSRRARSNYTAGDGRVLYDTSDIPEPLTPVAEDPYVKGAWYSISMALTALIIFGVDRALFKPTYSVFSLDIYDTAGVGGGHLIVHPAIGCWFYLTALALFFVTSFVGVLVSDRPTWEPELRRDRIDRI